MEEGLLEKTGKSLDYWIKVVKKSNLAKHKEIVVFLKENHGFTHGYANFVALKSLKSDAASHDPESLVTAQYKGKESLKPIFEQLVAEISKFGSDITITPKKDSTSIIRKHQFALIKPATKKRIDLGLKLKGVEPSGRLGPSGPFGAMCTHRIQITEQSEIDSTVLAYLKQAYDASV